MRDFARKLALPVNRDRLRLIAGIVEDLNFPRLDDEKLERAIANCNQRFAIAVTFRRKRSAIRRLGDLRLIENRIGNGMESVFSHGSDLVLCASVAMPLDALQPASTIAPLGPLSFVFG